MKLTGGAWAPRGAEGKFGFFFKDLKNSYLCRIDFINH